MDTTRRRMLPWRTGQQILRGLLEATGPQTGRMPISPPTSLADQTAETVTPLRVLFINRTLARNLAYGRQIVNLAELLSRCGGLCSRLGCRFRPL